MKLEITTCYSHVLYFMTLGEKVKSAVHSFRCSSPNFSCEGMAGYVEVKVVFEIKDLPAFTEAWQGWYTLPSETRSRLYATMLGRSKL